MGHVSSQVRILPLGGSCHVGGNMMVYETARDIILVDCGVLFPGPDEPGIKAIHPNIQYVLERKDKFRGYFITHGHEDHIGALPYVFGALPGPIFGSRFTLGVIRHKFGNHLEHKIDLQQLEYGKAHPLNELQIEPIHVTHSIPGSCMFAIHTPCGIILHTGDFKLDPTPLDGVPTGLKRIQELGQQGITALVSDSTNSGRPGRTVSEQVVRDTLWKAIGEADMRVFVTTFASNVHRMQTVIDASYAQGRYVIPIGSSIHRFLDIAKSQGLLTIHPNTLKKPQDYAHLPASKVTVLATGCQGEMYSAMWRMANNSEPHVRPQAGDKVIMSARKIPGNEIAISEMVDGLLKRGIEVIDPSQITCHTSGHAFIQEQLDILDMTRPDFFVPSHGTTRLIMQHAKTAREAGYPAGRIFVLEDGTPLDLTPGEEPSARLGSPETSGLVLIDGHETQHVGQEVLEERKRLSQNGVVVCIAPMGANGEVTAPVIVTTQGVVNRDQEDDLCRRCSETIMGMLNNLPEKRRTHYHQVEAIRKSVRRFFYNQLGRKPQIMACVVPSPDENE